MRTIRVAVALAAVVTMALLAASCSEDEGGPETLVVISHESFDIERSLLATFEEANNAKVEIRQGGDANEVVNRVLLNAGNPEGDVLFGIDNLTFPRTVGEGLFEEYSAVRRAQIPADIRAQFGDSTEVTPIDYGYVALNFDKAQGEPPARFEDLTQPEWRGKLVVEDPATSSPGLQFLATTVAHFGESGSYTWQDYWRELRENDVLVVDGWDVAYNTQFSHYGGDRSLVVSYTTSPAAELFFSEGAATEPPTANVIPEGSKLFRQVEGAAILEGTEHSELARKFIDFLLLDAFQKQIPETMFVYPAIPNLETPEWWRWAEVDVEPATIEVDADMIERWISEWTEIMRR